MISIADLAKSIQADVVGDPTRQIVGVADLASAGPEHLSFLANPKYRVQFEASRAGAILVSEAMPHPHATLLVCPDPYLAMASLATALQPQQPSGRGIESGAHVHPEAQVDKDAWIRAGAVVDALAKVGPRTVVGACCVVGHAANIGADCLLHPGSKVLQGCIVGDRVTLQAGAVIGSDGFGFAVDAHGRRQKIPQIGIVKLGDDVEVGANTTIDRATFGVTNIGPGCKIDNLVQIAHNVELGNDGVVVSQSGIAGSAKLGARVIVGPQVGVLGHITIADDVKLAARSGVLSSIEESGVYSGAPVMAHQLWRRMVVAQRALPDIRRRVRALEKRIAAFVQPAGASRKES